MNPPPILQTLSLSEPQQMAALARSGDVAVTAGAGTGKTRTLVARYLALLADGLPLRQIVAVTFTRKAAREMRNRIRQEIGAYLSAGLADESESRRWQAAYNDLDAARIGTIHNLCAEILRAHPAEAGIDPRFAVLDETQAALLAQEAVEAALAWAVQIETLTPLFGLLRERPLQDLLLFLLQNRLAVQAITQQLPPGHILAHWQSQIQAEQTALLAQLLADPAFMAAATVLRRSQAHNPNDLAEVPRQLAITALDSLEGETLAGQLRNLAVLDEIKLAGGSQKNWPGGKEELDAVKSALKCLRGMWQERPLLKLRLNPQDEAIAAAMPAVYALFVYADQFYQARKAERDGLDFDDLEALSMRLLESQPAVRAYWQAQMSALLVDEFQDTNTHQRQLIRLLCPDAGKLFIVGDAKQSIYRFRGADVAVFAAEKAHIARQNGRIIDLDTSYRAHELLLAGINHLLRPVLGDDSPERPSYAAPFAPLRPGTKKLAAGLTTPFVEFHLALGNKGDALPLAAVGLAGRLAQLHADHDLDYGAMAILCRGSNSFQYYENALDAAGIPYLTVAGKGFYERPEIRDLLNALQAIADPHDDLALAGLLRSPACGLSDVALYRLRQAQPMGGSLWQTAQQTAADADADLDLRTAVTLVQELNQQVGRKPVADIFKQFLDQTQYRAILRRTGQPRALRNVAKLLADIHGSELVSVSEFLEYAQTLRDSGSREGEARATAGGAVQIMSIHAAKGLEFPVVVLGDAGSGSPRSGGVLVDGRLGILLPQKDETQEQAASYQLGALLAKEQEDAETARLLYVALTRAEQLLFISGAAPQNKAGRFSGRGWLGQLAAIVGLENTDLSGYDEAGDGRFIVECAAADTAVRAAIYEPNYKPPIWPAAKDVGDGVGERPSSYPPLQEPIAAPTLPDADSPDEDTPQRVWQVVPAGRRPEAPAWVIGSLVHQALALWRFPGADFAPWVWARAREFGLTDAKQLAHAQTESARLLQRFRRSALFQEMDQADQRLPEVPYSYLVNGRVQTGYIDMLYEQAGSWTLVDFKTDHVGSEADLQRLLSQTDYTQQLRQYGRAVQQLLGITPRLKLCLLNYGREVRLIDVAAN